MNVKRSQSLRTPKNGASLRVSYGASAGNKISTFLFAQMLRIT
jgi:hypothetical protein